MHVFILSFFYYFKHIGKITFFYSEKAYFSAKNV